MIRLAWRRFDQFDESSVKIRAASCIGKLLVSLPLILAACVDREPNLPSAEPRLQRPPDPEKSAGDGDNDGQVPEKTTSGTGTPSRESAAEVILRHREKIMAMPGVVGLAVARCRTKPNATCIHVYSRTGDWPSDLPRVLGAYSVEVVTKKGGFRPL